MGEAHLRRGRAQNVSVSRRRAATQCGVDGTKLPSVGGTRAQKLCQRHKCTPTLMPVCHMAILFSYVSLGSQGRMNCPRGHSCWQTSHLNKKGKKNKPLMTSLTKYGQGKPLWLLNKRTRAQTWQGLGDDSHHKHQQLTSPGTDSSHSLLYLLF